MSINRFFSFVTNKFNAAEEGNVAIYFALSLAMVFSVIGIGFDYSRALNLKDTLNAAADAAALAVARDPDIDSDNLQSRAEAFFNANTQSLPFGYSANISARELVGGDGVRIDVAAKIDTTLMALAGITSFDVTAKSEAVYSTNKIEMVLVLDNTGSMRGNKIRTLRSASHDMVNTLFASSTAIENVRVGIIPFNIGVNVGTENATASWLHDPSRGSEYNEDDHTWHGCVGPRFPDHDVTDSNANNDTRIPPIYRNVVSGRRTSCDIPSLLPLTNDTAALHSKIDDMEADGYTYIPEGLAWGWRVLSNKKPYQEGVVASDTDWQKILVLMTDGDNSVRWSWSDNIPSARTRSSSSTGDDKTEVLCENVKDAGIIIYTIAFQVNSSSTRELLEDCATTPGNYFDARNNAALETIFSKIGGDINNLRLSK